MSYYSQQNFFADVSGLNDAESKVAVSTMTTSKPFIYLVQTEQCLPQNLASSARIGNSKTCNCDVIVLSFKEECQDKNSSHISYIFAKETSWTQGRNLLYFVAKERIPRYHYYIFMDDDLDIEFNMYSSEEMKKMPPNRAFEQWLLDDEPAIGIVEDAHIRLAEKLLERWERICKNTDSTIVIPAILFDANFNAFHHQAIEHILPYESQYDRDSWWLSQYLLVYSAEVMFRGQVLENIALTVRNPKHRDYPRGLEKMDEIRPSYIEEIRKKTPRAYQNCSLFETLKSSNFLPYLKSTDTYCLNRTHRYPIVPFSHFKERC